MAQYFLGDQSDLDKILEKENRSKSKSELAEEIQARSARGRITENDDEELSEDLLKRLKRTRIINKDLYDVYMVEDPDYYDPYYNNPEGVDNNPILALARTIKRVYKTYPEYLAALSIREDYVEYLVDKYGGMDRYMMMKRVGAVKDWMPPTPLYSKMAYDRHIVDYGVFISPDDVEVDDELIREWVEEKVDSLHTNPEDLEVKFDIFTDIRRYNNEVLKRGELSKQNRRSNERRALSASDVEDLNSIVKSWYVEEEVNKEDKHKEMFALSPENIRKKYFQDIQIGDPDRLDRIMDTGEEIEDEFDPDELVVDDSTGKTMKAGELRRRQTIRAFAKCGWDEIALLQESGTASNHELNMMKRARKNKKKAKRFASTAASDLLGVDSLSMIQDSAMDIFGPDITASIFGRGSDDR